MKGKRYGKLTLRCGRGLSLHYVLADLGEEMHSGLVMMQNDYLPKCCLFPCLTMLIQFWM